MPIGENLFDNLLVAGIILSLIVIIYCKIKNQTLGDIFREIKGVTDE